MATKHVSDWQVCWAYSIYAEAHEKWPYELLMELTGQCLKVCCRACERADARGFIDHGTSLRTGWLTEKGRELLATTLPDDQNALLDALIRQDRHSSCNPFAGE